MAHTYHKNIKRVIADQSVTDLMYVLVCDDGYFTDLHHRIYILIVAYILHQLYGVLTFSSDNKNIFI